MTQHTPPKFLEKALKDMTPREWEALCDGCGRCCLHKLGEEDLPVVHYTNVACRLLDPDTCRCRNYRQRTLLVPDCVTFTAKSLPQAWWLPKSCAYRTLLEGRPLAWWHPLISGDPATVHQAGISVRGKTIPEAMVPEEELEHHFIDWIDY